MLCNMNTKQEVMAVLDDFAKEYSGLWNVWGISVGPGPTEYDSYGKCRRENKSECMDYALHVFTSISTELADTVELPIYYKGVRTMLFFERE